MKTWYQTHIEGLHGNMRHFVVDSLHYGSQAVLWSEREENSLLVRWRRNNKLTVLKWEMLLCSQVLIICKLFQNVLYFNEELFEPQCCLNATEPLSIKGPFPAYPLGVVPILSQMSMMSPQSSVVLFSLVAFSVNMSKKETVHMVQWENIFTGLMAACHQT